MTETDTKKCEIKVAVGYGWQKFDYGDADPQTGWEVLSDTFWKSLYAKINMDFSKMEEKFGVKVCYSRLRASHGRLVWPTIRNRILKADVLIFDVAQAPDKDVNLNSVESLDAVITKLNYNVLVEIGVALANDDKNVMLLCPRHLFDSLPSDLKGHCWSTYTGSIENGVLKRTFCDEPGFNGAYVGMIRDVARQKAESNLDRSIEK